MSAISKFTASLVSATNENTFALANFNIDFALLKVEPPVEYKGLQSVLSLRRKENAEQGYLHRTARKLGALFEQIVPPIQTLIEVYGRRVSEISTSDRIRKQGTIKEGPFASHVGPDGSSIYAAATSGSSALAVHLLACMLARSWSGPEAIAIWVELVAERKRDIIENTDGSQIQGMAARVAAQQDITRAELARWDASARSWLLCGDEVKCFEQTQLRLITKNTGMWASSVGNTYQNVMDVWIVAMTSLQKLILGMPQRISKGALLLGLSSWHIYPDLIVVSPPTKVNFQDNLVAPGGSIILGLQNADQEDMDGVKWSLALAHLRYYGDPVSKSSKSENIRITINELHFIALGSMISGWMDCNADIMIAVRFFDTLYTCLGEPLESSYPWLYLILQAARTLLTTTNDLERSNALSLITYGKRKAKTFLDLPKNSPLPALGLSHPLLLWRLSNEHSPDKSTDIEHAISNLRNLAQKCGYEPYECLIQYQLLDGTFEYATAIPYLSPSQKHNRDGSMQLQTSHARWIPLNCKEDRFRTITTVTNRNERCYHYDPENIRNVPGQSMKSERVLAWLHSLPLAFGFSSARINRDFDADGNLITLTRSFPKNASPDTRLYEPGDYDYHRSARFYSVAHYSDKVTLFTIGPPSQEEVEIDTNSSAFSGNLQTDAKNTINRDSLNNKASNNNPNDISSKKVFFSRPKRKVKLLSTEDVIQCLSSGQIIIHLLRDYFDRPTALMTTAVDEVYFQSFRRHESTATSKSTLNKYVWSLLALQESTELYRTLPGATISMNIASKPLCDVWTITSKYSYLLDVPLREVIEPRYRAQKFANIAVFESGLHIDYSTLLPVMAMSSGNSIFVSEALLQDPLEPDQSVKPENKGIRRIFGNLGRPGIVMLAPPQAPRIQALDPGLWRLINHAPFNGKDEDCFANTSLHLSFTEYEVPLNVSIGDVDAEVTMLESLVSVYNNHEWIADLDILGSLAEPEFRRFRAPRCSHDAVTEIIQKESVATQMGRATGKSLISIDNWLELLDPPDNLESESMGVLRASRNWQARLAAMSVSIQCGYNTIVVPSSPLCVTCGTKAVEDMARVGEILII